MLTGLFVILCLLQSSLGQVCSLFVGVAVSAAPVPKPQCEVGRIDLLPVEKEHLNILLQQLSMKLCSETLLTTHHLLCCTYSTLLLSLFLASPKLGECWQ